MLVDDFHKGLSVMPFGTALVHLCVLITQNISMISQIHANKLILVLFRKLELQQLLLLKGSMMEKFMFSTSLVLKVLKDITTAETLSPMFNFYSFLWSHSPNH